VKIRNRQLWLSGEVIPRKDGRMDHTPAVGEARRKQQLRSRVFWFLAGAGVNYLLIVTPFKWLTKHTSMPILAISGCSFGVSTSFFFVWNYFINFRTDARKRDALARYLTAVACMWASSSAILAGLKHIDLHPILSVGRFSLGLDRDIIATQFCLSGIKFLLYHKWVFPVAQGEE
jgi:GtrA-like protein